MNYEQSILNHNRGKEYSQAELQAFVDGYLQGSINDELMTKFIKSIYDHDLSVPRLADFTNIMMRSGDLIDLSDVPGIKVDKHSTGGVGDKVTLILGPIIAALGGVFAKMSGRGLGFTGGTADKLESIPGFNLNLNIDQFKANLKKYGIVVVTQMANLVPADAKIYALRDVTGYVDSFSLVASSVMAKKLATGADAILLDVKCGDAAFMKNEQDATQLAKLMIQMGTHLKKDVRVEITTMDSPLGKAIGNKNEVLEAIAFLDGQKVSSDLEEVIFSSATTMLLQAKIVANEKQAHEAITNVITSKKALAKFKEWIAAQGGNLNKLFAPDFWSPRYQHVIKAKKKGYMDIKSAVTFGMVAMKLGAGRKRKDDIIDFEAGINLNVKQGDPVIANMPLMTLYSSKPISQALILELESAYQINTNQIKKQTILKKIANKG